MEILKQYDYRPRKGEAVVCFFLALCGMVMFTCAAFLLDRPLELPGVHLTARQVRMVVGAIALLSPCVVVALGIGVYLAFYSEGRVALTTEHIILPRPTLLGLTTDEIQIPFNSISSVKTTQLNLAVTFLRIEYMGRMTSVASNMFASRNEFAEFCHAVQTEFHRRACQ